jgi:hypothetical protein
MCRMDDHFRPEQWFETQLRKRFGPRHGWITRACIELRISRQTFDYWRTKGIPKERARQVRAVCKT